MAKHGILTRIKAAAMAFRGFESIADLDRRLDAVGSDQSVAGTTVDRITAINLSAVFNAVTLITGMMASLPLHLYERISDTKRRRLSNHPTAKLLEKPNEEMLGYIWREIAQNHLLMQGNHYAQKIPDTTGRIVRLWPWNPQAVRTEKKAGRLKYIFLKNDGTEMMLDREQVLHIPGLGFDGRKGYSVLELARDSFGLGMALQEFGGRFFGDGTHLGGFLRHPGELSEKAHDALETEMKEKYHGIKKSHQWILLEEGTEAQPLGIAPEDAQFLGSRLFEVQEVARWFNLPPSKLKDLSGAIKSNIEQEQLSYVGDTILPWAVRMEMHLTDALLMPEERESLYIEYNMEGALRADTESRNKAYEIMRRNGALNANEWRAKENMDAIAGPAGNVYVLPVNYANAEMIAQSPPEPPSNDAIEEDRTLRIVASRGDRAARSQAERRRLANQYQGLFERAVDTILKRESNALLKIARESFNTRDADQFIAEVQDWYEEQEPWIQSQYAGVYTAYGDDIYPIAAAEVGAEDDVSDAYRKTVEAFIATATIRHIISSRGQIIKVAVDAEWVTDKEREEAIEKRVQRWEKDRALKIARRESVDGESGAIGL
jgi:HK97 family phage portal protein